MKPAPTSPKSPAPRQRGLSAGSMLSGPLVLVTAVAWTLWGPDLLVPGWTPLHRAAVAAVCGALLLIVLQAVQWRALSRKTVPRASASPSASTRSAAPRTRPAELPRDSQSPAQLAAEASAKAALHDPLTRLLNRRAFEASVAGWLERATPSAKASLLHIDLDRFKPLNDQAGRAAGDALLQEAAAVLRAHVRAGDAVARLEGDTYALLLPGCVASVAVQLAQRLQAELASLGVTVDGQRLGVGATIGVAQMDRAAELPASDWLARSQAAWYEAKYGGQGAVRLAAAVSELPLVLPA